MINFRNIEYSDFEEIRIWEKWENDLGMDDILRCLENFYELVIIDIFHKNFLTDLSCLNFNLHIEENKNIKTYLGSNGECLVMFSIIEGYHEPYRKNISKISNILEKKFIIRDILLKKLE